MPKSPPSRSAGTVLHLPPFTTCRMCVNRLSDWCLEECAPARDYRRFELMPGLDITDMPRLRLAEWQQMPSAVRQIVAGVYLGAIVDHLQGVRREQPTAFGVRSRRLLEGIPVAGLLPAAPAPDPADAPGAAGLGAAEPTLGLASPASDASCPVFEPPDDAGVQPQAIVGGTDDHASPG